MAIQGYQSGAIHSSWRSRTDPYRLPGGERRAAPFHRCDRSPCLQQCEGHGGHWPNKVQQQHAAVAVLNIRAGNQRVQHETERVDEKVALLALDQLAAVEARRVDAGTPFSAPLTLWLSITQAVGVISRPARSRHWV